jgi:hypothetical protein
LGLRSEWQKEAMAAMVEMVEMVAKEAMEEKVE